MRALRSGIGDVSWWVYPLAALAGVALGAVVALIRGGGSGDDSAAPDSGGSGGGVALLVIGLVFVAALVAVVIYAVRINSKGRARRFDRAYGKRAERMDKQYNDNELVQKYGDPERREPIPEHDRPRAIELSEQKVTSLVPLTVGGLLALPFYLASLFVTSHVVFDEAGRVGRLAGFAILSGILLVQLGRARLVLERERRVPPAPAVDE